MSDPQPALVLISDSVSQGTPVPAEQPERAFWAVVVERLLSHPDRLASASWPGVEIALLIDPRTSMAHIVEHSGLACKAQPVATKEIGLLAWQGRLRALLGESGGAA
ncbi:hypothetical protein AB0O34_11555 [Sphaerisporangium sp. NPDC088356]|uniref:hypothetical protein n=1 Tax=Sphaerisporangium sp. NPDC088356 TaxID=3154871 RepID=UPI00341C8BBA